MKMVHIFWTGIVLLMIAIFAIGSKNQKQEDTAHSAGLVSDAIIESNTNGTESQTETFEPVIMEISPDQEESEEPVVDTGIDKKETSINKHTSDAVEASQEKENDVSHSFEDSKLDNQKTGEIRGDAIVGGGEEE